VVVGIVVATLFVGACNGSEEPLGPAATLPQPTTTTDPYAVPAVIDEAYVNRVLAGLDHAVGDVTRSVVSERAVSADSVDRLKALYTGEFLRLSVASYEADMRNGFSGYRESPGDKTTVVTRLIAVSPKCIFAEVARNYSEVSKSPQSTSTEWVAIEPSDVQSEPDSNPTGWVFVYDGFDPGRTEPTNPCVGTP